MVIGRGMIAKAFTNYTGNNDVIIFASGVSNSLEQDPKEFQREFDLIEKTLKEYPSQLFVYFSTCSMYDPFAKDTHYVQHKLKMEQYISQQRKHFLILRVSQILGKSKNKTLINFLFDHIQDNKPFNLWKNSNRNLIALSDIIKITQVLMDDEKYHKNTYHIVNKYFIDMTDLVKILEELLHKKANYTLIDKGCHYDIIPNDIEDVTKKLNIEFNVNYYANSLKQVMTQNNLKGLLMPIISVIIPCFNDGQYI